MHVRFACCWYHIIIVGGALVLSSLPVDVHAQAAPTTTSAIVSAGLNLGGLDDLLKTVREDLVPEVVVAMNEFISNNLSFSRSESVLGVTVSVSAAITQFILQTADDSVRLQVEQPGTTSTRIRLNASNLKLGASASATVGVSAVGLGGVSCYLGVDGIADVQSVELALGVAKSASNGNDIAISPADATVPSFVIGLTPKTSTNTLCNIVNQVIATAFGVVTTEISRLALNLFDGQLVNGLANVIDGALVPIAQFEPSFSVGNVGIIRPSLGLEKISAVSNTLVVDVGGGLNVELRQPQFRAGRSLSASDAAKPRTMPQVTVDGLVGMHINLGTFNRLVEAMWYLGRSALGGADDERVTRESSLCKEQAQSSDPCPYPPVSYTPTFFGEFIMFFLFLGYRSFGVEAILLPPAVDVASGDLQGKVASRVAITGRSLFGLGGREVLATAGVDVSLTTGLPQYDGATGIVSNVKIAQINAVDFDLDYGLFPVFWIFTSLAQSFITDFAVKTANDFIGAANDEIAAFLQRTPLFQIPTIRKFPTARTDVQLSLANVSVVGVPTAGSAGSFLSLDAGLGLAVNRRSDAPLTPPASSQAKSAIEISPVVYRETYESCLALAVDDPDSVVTGSYSSFDGSTSVLYTCRRNNGRVEMLDSAAGTWSSADAP